MVDIDAVIKFREDARSNKWRKWAIIIGLTLVWLVLALIGFVMIVG